MKVLIHIVDHSFARFGPKLEVERAEGGKAENDRLRQAIGDARKRSGLRLQVERHTEHNRHVRHDQEQKRLEHETNQRDQHPKRPIGDVDRRPDAG